MEHRTLDQITQVASIAPADGRTARTVRRERLRRLTDVLRAYEGPLRLLTRIEYVPMPERAELRGEFSPLALAYQDAPLRRAGLAGDTLGDAMAFFSLSQHQVHHLFCDCHYGIGVDAKMVAARVSSVAERLSWRERWDKISAWVRPN
jgi:hypothetical protein